MPTKKYKIDGKRVPGTTTVIGTSLGWGKEGLLHWAWQQGADGKDFREERKNAANAGTVAHALAEADIKGKVYVPEPGLIVSDEDRARAETAFSAYKQWKEMSKLRLIASELSLVSRLLMFGGTLDAVAWFGDAGRERVDVVDFKTSNGTYADHLIQLAAYRHLAEEGDPFESEWRFPDLAIGRKISGIHLLRFSKESASFHHSYYPASDMDKPFAAFKHLRELYGLKKSIEGML